MVSLIRYSGRRSGGLTQLPALGARPPKWTERRPRSTFGGLQRDGGCSAGRRSLDLFLGARSVGADVTARVVVVVVVLLVGLGHILVAALAAVTRVVALLVVTVRFLEVHLEEIFVGTYIKFYQIIRETNLNKGDRCNLYKSNKYRAKTFAIPTGGTNCVSCRSRRCSRGDAGVGRTCLPASPRLAPPSPAALRRSIRASRAAADPQPRPHQLALDERGHLRAEVGLPGAGDPSGGASGGPDGRVGVAVAALVLVLHRVEGLGQIRPDVELAATVVVAAAVPPVDSVGVLERVIEVFVSIAD